MELRFDADLVGSDGKTLPVNCEVLPAHVGGQKTSIEISVPSKFVTLKPPKNPCRLSGQCGPSTVTMEGVYWKSFPRTPKSQWGLQKVELTHIESITISRPSVSDSREIRFHLAPISHLRAESSFVHFGDKSHREDLFELDLPELGQVKFIAEWATVYHRDSEIPGATVNAGFSALISFEKGAQFNAMNLVENFKSSLLILSVLFRQAVTLHGWTYTDGQSTTTWIDPLEPNVTPSFQEDRGEYVAQPQLFVEWATNLARAYAETDEKKRSLVRHLSLAVNPHVRSRSKDRFLFMFTALERVIEFAWKNDQTPLSPAITTSKVITHLKELQAKVLLENSENAIEISERLKGLVGVVNRPSVRNKFEAFLRVYPTMNFYCADLWPVLSIGKNRGLKDVRDSIAHGASSFVPVEVVAVAEWHLAILLERVIFVLLNMSAPVGIAPNSYLLRHGARGWYERNRWEPLQSKPDHPI